jgi:hypothetical protein
MARFLQYPKNYAKIFITSWQMTSKTSFLVEILLVVARKQQSHWLPGMRNISFEKVGRYALIQVCCPYCVSRSRRLPMARAGFLLPPLPCHRGPATPQPQSLVVRRMNRQMRMHRLMPLEPNQNFIGNFQPKPRGRRMAMNHSESILWQLLFPSRKPPSQLEI